MPVASWVLGGIGVAATASFVGFALAGKSAQSNELEACKPNCSSRAIDAVFREYLVADISLGVAVVSLAVATVLAVRGVRPRTTSAVLGSWSFR